MAPPPKRSKNVEPQKITLNVDFLNNMSITVEANTVNGKGGDEIINNIIEQLVKQQSNFASNNNNNNDDDDEEIDDTIEITDVEEPKEDSAAADESNKNNNTTIVIHKKPVKYTYQDGSLIEFSRDNDNINMFFIWQLLSSTDLVAFEFPFTSLKHQKFDDIFDSDITLQLVPLIKNTMLFGPNAKFSLGTGLSSKWIYYNGNIEWGIVLKFGFNIKPDYAEDQNKNLVKPNIPFDYVYLPPNFHANLREQYENVHPGFPLNKDVEYPNKLHIEKTWVNFFL